MTMTPPFAEVDSDLNQMMEGSPAEPTRPHRRRRRILLGILIAAFLVAGSLTGAGLWFAQRLPSNVGHVKNAFQGLNDSVRPSKPAEVQNSLNFLLVGTDSRSDEPTTGNDAAGPSWRYGAQRSDVMMLVHLAADRSSAAVVSLPRDSWVPIPGHGTMKLNAAYSWGGPPLLISTVEQLSGIRIDHFAVVDFYGLKAVVDNLNGIDIQLDQPAAAGQYRLAAGANHLNGDKALAYVRERYSLPAGDLDRVRRQQNLLRSILAKANTINPVRDPVQTYRLLDAATKSVSVDDTLTQDKMRSLALSAIGLRSGNIAFLTAPTRGTGREGGQSVVYLDEARDRLLWSQIHDDRINDYIASHPNELLSETPK